MKPAEKIFSALIKRDLKAEEKMSEHAHENLPANALRQISASALQSSGDQTVNASTVLPWIFSTLGVPIWLTGLLVPIRESLSMLPQAFTTPLILRVRSRKWVFVTGALVQAAAVAAMALTTALATGLTAGVLIIAALIVFSLGRSLTSVSSKDVQGRTIPKGERGQINGIATMAAGVVAITLGFAIRFYGGDQLSSSILALILAAGAAMWVLVALIYVRIEEPTESASASADKTANKITDEATTKTRGQVAEKSTADSAEKENWLRQIFALLRDDKPFRNFVIMRSLLLVSALSPPFFVTLSVISGADSLTGLGGFVIASGVASLIGGRVFGRLADRSSRRLMSFGAAFASLTVFVAVALVALPFFDGASLFANMFFVGVYFLLTLTHTGVRVGRKTYITDMAEGDLRTKYVAVSNSAMGFILLLVGGLSSLLAAFNIYFALLFLATLGAIGAFSGLRLPEVSRATSRR